MTGDLFNFFLLNIYPKYSIITLFILNDSGAINIMTDNLKISELIQKFGLAFGKKHIYQTIQQFIERLSKAEACVFVFAQKDGTRQDGERFQADMISSSPSSKKFDVSEVTELLEPVVRKYGISASAGDSTHSDIFDFDFFSSAPASRAQGTRRFQKDSGINGSLIVPIFIDNAFFSVFALLSSDEFSLSTEEFSAINIIAYTASISLKNILLKQRANEAAHEVHEKKRHLARNSRRTSDILELSSKLSATGTYDGILSEVLNAYSSIFSIEQAAVMNVNNQKKEILIEHAIGLKSSFISDYRSPEDGGLIGSSIQKSTPYFRRGPFERTQELAVIPFSGVSGLPSGAVVLYDRSFELAFSEDDFETMWLISNIMAIALNALKIKSLNTARTAGHESETRNLEALLNIVAPAAGIKGVFERSFEILTGLLGPVSFAVASEESEGKLRFAYFHSPNGPAVHAGYISSGGAFIKKALEASSPQLSYCVDEITLDDGTSVSGAISGTTAAIPLSAPSNRFVYIISAVPSALAEKVNDRNLLALIARTLEKALEYEAAYRESAGRNYNETQNLIAREIQKKLLPQSIVSTPKFQIEAYCEAALPVGGDYYDIIHNESGNTVSVLLADISGRGINSAMIAAMIRTQIHTLIKNNFDTRKLLYNLNNLICDDIDLYNFITLFFLQLSLTGNRAAFCNAAHNPILHYIKDGRNVVAHESRNSPLGILKNMEFKEGILLLDSGDILLLYTNGLAEIKSPAGDFFGRERLVSFIQDNAELSARDFKEKLLETIFEYSNSIQHEDDITFVVIKVV